MAFIGGGEIGGERASGSWRVGAFWTILGRFRDNSASIPFAPLVQLDSLDFLASLGSPGFLGSPHPQASWCRLSMAFAGPRPTARLHADFKRTLMGKMTKRQQPITSIQRGRP